MVPGLAANFYAREDTFAPRSRLAKLFGSLLNNAMRMKRRADLLHLLPENEERGLAKAGGEDAPDRRRYFATASMVNW